MVWAGYAGVMVGGVYIEGEWLMVGEINDVVRDFLQGDTGRVQVEDELVLDFFLQDVNAGSITVGENR
jgi:hypothetical protein